MKNDRARALLQHLLKTNGLLLLVSLGLLVAGLGDITGELERARRELDSVKRLASAADEKSLLRTLEEHVIQARGLHFPEIELCVSGGNHKTKRFYRVRGPGSPLWLSERRLFPARRDFDAFISFWDDLQRGATLVVAEAFATEEARAWIEGNPVPVVRCPVGWQRIVEIVGADHAQSLAPTDHAVVGALQSRYEYQLRDMERRLLLAVPAVTTEIVVREPLRAWAEEVGVAVSITRSEYAFPALMTVSRRALDTRFSALEAFIEQERRREGQHYEIFGLRIPPFAIGVLGPLLLLFFQLYFAIHLHVLSELDKSVVRVTGVPWIGIYEQLGARILFVVTAFILPVGVGIYLLQHVVSAGEAVVMALGVVIVLGLAGITVCAWSRWCKTMSDNEHRPEGRS